MRIDVENRTRSAVYSVKFSELGKCAASCLRLPKKAAVNIFMVEAEEIKKLNRANRKINAVTDVLSFPLNERKPFDEDAEGLIMLGDIVINPSYVQRNTKEDVSEKNNRILFLAVHGLLHLCGYDHGTDRQQKKMDEMSDNILQCVNNHVRKT